MEEETLMATILTYGSAALRNRALPVTQVTEEIRRLVREMLDTMYAANGVGLAAQQIGRTEAVCVIDVPPSRDAEPSALPRVPMPLILLNPRIVESNGEVSAQEGCLSFPEIYVTLTRSARVVVRYMDLEGREQEVQADGLLARAIQHELDHLNGVLLVDRMNAVQKIAFAGRLKRLRWTSQDA